MKKRALMALSLLWLTAGCSEDVDVVRYGHVEEHWQAERVTINSQEPEVNAETILNQCEDKERLAELDEETFSVLGMAYATRAPFMNEDYDGYAFDEVTYVEGDAVYALCRSERMDGQQGYRAVELEARPSFLKDEVGTEISFLPTVHVATENERASLHKPDAFYENGQDIEPYPVTLMRISPGFSGTVEIGIGEGGYFNPSFHFLPNLRPSDVFIALGRHTETNLPLLLLSYGGDKARYSSSILQDADLLNGADSLTFRRIHNGGTMEPMTPYPLYELTINLDGQMVTKTLSMRYRPNPPLTEIVNSDEVALAYLHKYPYHREVPLPYPDAVNVSGEAYDRLIEAIETARPSTKSGETNDYKYLTLLHGNLGQQFEVSYQQRSKKVDVFVKDVKTGEVFKLSSAGAETFQELFPQAFE
ncbi:hypothetical protein EVJ33_05215 [Exiguobacterium sp. SL-10]|uniref:hypothetical protein n=1 Tax=Exiguobacterium sp. SL-10 TaxID=2510962 RepID=UPI00103B29F0|nr:hypothetical protein [Exiguobacterium sp. SL-10]TCI30698.1 hypothetical protein EVJ33_05215 [Exiguobacterium sp. SL-10]